MSFASLEVRRPCSAGIALVLLVGCSSDQEPHAGGTAPQLSVQAQAAASPDFVLDADVSMRADVDPSFRFPEAAGARRTESALTAAVPPAALREQRFDYHISYVDSGGRIVVNLTPPASRQSGVAAETPSSPSIWSHVTRIRFSSDIEAPTVTLSSGREVVVDSRFVDGLFGAQAARARSAATERETPARRGRRLQGMISPFVRIRAGRPLTRAGFATRTGGSDSDSSASLRSTWARASDDFDVAVHRVMTRPNGKAGRVLSLTVEVANAKVAGVPTPLP